MPSTKSPLPEHAAGAQRPRLFHAPEFVASSADEAIELARLAGLHLEDWQQFILRHAMGERDDGGWSAPTVGVVVGRQNGKGAVLEARELWGLYLGGERLIIHTAHNQKTATNHFKRLKKLIRDTPELLKRVDGWKPGMQGDPPGFVNGKGSEAIRLKDGAEIFFNTRGGGGGSGRGLTANTVVFDEAMYLTEDEVEAFVPTGAAQSMAGAMQIWYTGSAVDQESHGRDGQPGGIPFTRVRQAGIGRHRATAWFEWSLPYDNPSEVPDDVYEDIESVRLTNPTYLLRMSADWVENERTVLMSRRGFLVERCGVGDYPDPTDDGSRVISSAAFLACAEHDSSNRITFGKTFAVDVSPDRAWGSIGVAGGRDDDLWQCAVADRRDGTSWIVERCVALDAGEGCSFVVLKRGPAANLIPELEAAGLYVEAIEGAEYGRACADLFDAIQKTRAARARNEPGVVRFPIPQLALEDALAGARKSTAQENAWTWSRKASTSPDISPLVAVTLALWGFRTQPALQPMVAFR